jgi:hypothetical protein
MAPVFDGAGEDVLASVLVTRSRDWPLVVVVVVVVVYRAVVAGVTRVVLGEARVRGVVDGAEGRLDFLGRALSLALALIPLSLSLATGLLGRDGRFAEPRVPVELEASEDADARDEFRVLRRDCLGRGPFKLGALAA